MTQAHYSLLALAQHVGGIVHGDPHCEIRGLATLLQAQSDQISFFNNPKYRSQLVNTRAGAVILTAQALADYPGAAAIVVADPYFAYAKIAQLYWNRPQAELGVHPTAIVHASVSMGRGVSIGPYVVIEAGCVLADDVTIGAHSFLGERCTLDVGTTLAPRVTLHYGVRVGQRCYLNSGVVIGSDGFGFAPHQGGYEKIPQLGTVVLGNDVDVGANTTIDRGALGDTIIGDGVKLDNQIQVGHNVKIGAHTVIAGCTGIAGSAEIGAHCMIGGASAIAGHITIADRVMLVGMSMVTNSITESGVYASGTGLLPRKDWQKSTVRFRQLDQLARTVSQLKKQSESREA